MDTLLFILLIIAWVSIVGLRVHLTKKWSPSREGALGGDINVVS